MSLIFVNIFFIRNLSFTLQTCSSAKVYYQQNIRFAWGLYNIHIVWIKPTKNKMVNQGLWTLKDSPLTEMLRRSKLFQDIPYWLKGTKTQMFWWEVLLRVLSDSTLEHHTDKRVHWGTHSETTCLSSASLANLKILKTNWALKHPSDTMTCWKDFEILRKIYEVTLYC